MAPNPLLLHLDPCSSIEVTCSSKAQNQQQRVTVTRVVNQKCHSETVVFEGNSNGEPMKTLSGKPVHIFEGGSGLQLLCKFEGGTSTVLGEPRVQDFENSKKFTIATRDDSTVLTVTVLLKCQRVQLQILKGMNLVAKDRSVTGQKTTSDPYISFQWDGKLLKTKVIPKNLNPVWNETFDLYWPLDKPFENITLQLFDQDLFSKHDSMGTVTIPAAFLTDGGSSNPTTYAVQASSTCTNATGEVEILVKAWNTTTDPPKEEKMTPTISAAVYSPVEEDPYAGLPSIFRPPS